MNFISRKDAIAGGLVHYFTGKPCQRGHIGPRNTSNSGCALCTRERAKEWASKNTDRYEANQRRWRADNKDKLREDSARYRTQNAEKIKKRPKRKYKPTPKSLAKAAERAREYRKKHPAKAAAATRRWCIAHPERAKEIWTAGSQNRRARVRAVGNICADDIKTVRIATHCAACGNTHPKMEVDHIVALSKGGTNHLSNLQLLCRPCNRSKWAKDQTAWAAERLIAHTL